MSATDVCVCQREVTHFKYFKHSTFQFRGEWSEVDSLMLSTNRTIDSPAIEGLLAAGRTGCGTATTTAATTATTGGRPHLSAAMRGMSGMRVIHIPGLGKCLT